MEESALPVAEKSGADQSNIIKYRRRLDRSPSHDFDSLSTDQKILISSLRTALEEAKRRVVKLREENEIKEDVIQEEREQRKHVEDNFQKLLVDVYNNPKINSELRERLPRAKKYDPLHVHTVRSNESNTGKHTDPLTSRWSNENLVESATVPLIQASIAHRTTSSVNTPGTVLLSPIGPTDLTTFVHDVQSQAHVASVYQDPGSTVGFENHPGIFTYPFLPHHAASSSSIGTAFSSSFLDLPQSSPAKEKDTTIEEGPVIPQPPVTEVESPSIYFPEWKKGDIDMDSFRRSNPDIPMSTINYHYRHNYKPPTDNVSHITRFLAEISTLKKENQELRTELEDKKHDFEILKDELQQTKTDGDKDDSVAALIEMVHSAGKTREQALAQMVSSAVQDRDATLGELDRMRLRMTEKSLPSVSNYDYSDLDETEENYVASAGGYISVDTEPGGMTETVGSDADQSLEELKNLLSRQREIMQEEMKEVLRQRDQALLKVAKLEKRLSSFELSEFSNDVTESVRAKLRIAETQRDIAMSKLRKISEDFGEVKLLNNLRHALVHDTDLKLKQASDKNRHYDSDKWEAVKNNNMTASLNKYADENNRLGKKIVLLEHQNNEQTQQIEKLQSLIKRQRQKLNALCAGPLLIED